MALRLDLNKFQAIKQAYLEYVKTGRCTADMLQNFAAYKPYLDADREIRDTKQAVKSQKEAERRRLEEQRRAEKKRPGEQKQAERRRKSEKNKVKTQRYNENIKDDLAKINAKWEATKAVIAPKKKRVTESAGGYDWDAPHPRVKKVRGRISPIVQRIQDVNTYDDLKHLMNSSFLDTIKKSDDFAVLKSAIIRCSKDHIDDQKQWLKILEQRKMALQQKTNPTHNINYIPPKPVIISIPMGGQNKRY